MERPIRLLAFVVCALLIGCTRTWVGSGPMLSPDGNFQVQIRCAGAYGHAYLDETSKECRVSVARNGSSQWLFTGSYDLAGSDVAFDVQWASQQRIVVDFFDFGPGVSVYDVKDKQAGRRAIRQVHLNVEPTSGVVVEQPAA